MPQATFASLWKLSQKCRDCFVILFIWSLYHGVAQWMPSPTNAGLMALVVFSRVFLDPVVVLLVAGRLLQAQTTSDRTQWSPVFRSTSRLYLRAFLLFVLLLTVNILVYRALSLDTTKADADLVGRWKTVSVALPLSLLKIVWVSALLCRGRGLITSAGRGVSLLLRSRPVLAALGVWILALYAESLYSPAQLQPRSQFLAVGWLVASAAILAVGLRLAYTVTLHQCGELFGVECPEYAATPGTGVEAGALAGEPEHSVSLGWVFVSFVPLLSVVAFFKGRAAARRLHWRSIRALLAYSCGLFFTLVHVLVLIGASLPRHTEPPTDYTFLSQADASIENEVKLLAAGDFQKAHDRLVKANAEAGGQSWPRLTALAITQHQLTRPDDAVATLERASALNPRRNEFHYLYGRLLLDRGQRSHAAEHLVEARKLGMKEELGTPLLNLARTSYEPARWVSITWSVLILVLLFTVHEFAHAYSAFKLGDRTAAEQGRLTLNPIAHLDIFGSLILPGLLLWRGSDLVFGWAKPVPVNPENFTSPKRDQMLVSFAGPAANLIAAMGGALLLLLLLVDVRLLSPDAQSLDLADPTATISLIGNQLPTWIVPVIAFLKQFVLTSVILACFNLIPMPPLDGSWILSGVAPQRFQAKLEAIRPYGFIIFLALVLTPVFDYLMAIPVLFLWAGSAACFALMGFS